MKKNMKLMNIYEIQKNHELHKRKLSSITSINTKHKTYQSVYSNIEKINTFKKNKVYTECFIQKQRKSRIQFENTNLHRKMLEVHQRHQLNTKESQRKVTSEGKRYRNSSMNERLVSENARIKERLMKTKGSFYGPTHQKKVKDTKKLSHQETSEDETKSCVSLDQCHQSAKDAEIDREIECNLPNKEQIVEAKKKS